MKKTLRVGIIGQSERPWEPLPENTAKIAFETGFLIAKNGWHLYTGGRDGVMRESSRGAKKAGGVTVGILPSLDKNEANEYVDVPITTGLGMSMRSELMINTVDVIVMIGGKNGTLKELLTAYLFGKPIVVIKGSGGFADTLEKFLFEGKYIDDRKNVEIKFANSPEEAVEFIKEALG
jgi:uncharacterized protein (TIGR00725 family)